MTADQGARPQCGQKPLHVPGNVISTDHEGPAQRETEGSGEIATMFPPRCGVREFYPGISTENEPPEALEWRPLRARRELGECLVSAWQKDTLSGSLH